MKNNTGAKYIISARNESTPIRKYNEVNSSQMLMLEEEIPADKSGASFWSKVACRLLFYAKEATLLQKRAPRPSALIVFPKYEYL
ncbi:MAG: hypothetical protein NTX50_18910 [Candidatus Sumerlaeota bacterium]|nr:hypothetical protein [Candidatus Sumerlaeota bacterium]